MARGVAKTIGAAAAIALACSPRGDAPPRPDDPLAGVVDPWSWPRARGATAHERALEDLGPWEPIDPRNPRSPAVSVNGDHWTRLVGLAWDRDVVIEVADEPVDLDGDGHPDTRVTRRVEARGGILANPELFGLIATPEDPRGRPGRVSASTGVLGLREALDRDGRRTGLIGMTCWLCHAGRNPDDGRVVLGLPNSRFDYGLLLATSALLDDGSGGRGRRALGFPTGRAAVARLLLAGPGRQDLTAEFGLDLGVPGLHSARYPGVRRLRQGYRGVFNPLSVPGLLRPAGLAVQNWSGSESSGAPWLEALAALVGQPLAAARAAFGLPEDDLALARRALLLDLRNLGTLGLQQDSFPALLFADSLRGVAHPPAATLRMIPPLYAVREVRAAAEEADAVLVRPHRDPAAVARGRILFTERVIGQIANRQVLRTVPPAYADTEVTAPLLAPLDPTRPLGARLPVRCADCHSAAPLATEVQAPAPPLGRCSHCHFGHPPAAAAEATRARAAAPAREVAACQGCHDRHPAFGPLSYSSGWLLPFDTDGDGNAQGDEQDDQRAGGIGTEALLSFDVPRSQRPTGHFSVALAAVADPRHRGAVERVTSGVAWVRVAPLVGVFATAPYLHNGSIPTLRDLLEAHRPRRFTVAGVPYDTTIPGNHNGGHVFGVGLSAREKDDLIAFLETL
jgi:hypothetical protein